MTTPTIRYLAGDATRPQRDGNKIIAHVCNDIGGWGRGFVVAVSKRWPAPEAEYRRWARAGGTSFALGEVQFVPVTDTITVANMIGQHDIRSKNGVPPIRYDAVRACLTKVAEHAAEHDASVHMPRIGAGLAGGSWKQIETIINDTLGARNISVYVYDLPGTRQTWND